eukprot:GHUV01033217.1.p1 GENE.GHUV01033217.1~~GHUV01033217.1.p1  ORF type:complete len:270 (+),score=61.54 GHUV01033217.1:364-1173(+)
MLLFGIAGLLGKHRSKQRCGHRGLCSLSSPSCSFTGRDMSMLLPTVSGGSEVVCEGLLGVGSKSSLPCQGKDVSAVELGGLNPPCRNPSSTTIGLTSPVVDAFRTSFYGHCKPPVRVESAAIGSSAPITASTVKALETRGVSLPGTSSTAPSCSNGGSSNSCSSTRPGATAGGSEITSAGGSSSAISRALGVCSSGVFTAASGPIDGGTLMMHHGWLRSMSDELLLSEGHPASPPLVICHAALEYSIPSLGYTNQLMYGGMGMVVDTFI